MIPMIQSIDFHSIQGLKFWPRRMCQMTQSFSSGVYGAWGSLDVAVRRASCHLTWLIWRGCFIVFSPMSSNWSNEQSIQCFVCFLGFSVFSSNLINWYHWWKLRMPVVTHFKVNQLSLILNSSVRPVSEDQNGHWRWRPSWPLQMAGCFCAFLGCIILIWDLVWLRICGAKVTEVRS